jgi:predicted DNA-binding ribbon-helix-helix protein
VVLTKDERRIAQLVRQLDEERRKRIHAERSASALRLVVARMMADRRKPEVKVEPHPTA